MGIMNSDQHFLAAKKITKAPYAVPQNTREAIPISLIYPDGIFEIEPGPGMRQFDKAYTFADINYLSLDDEEKERFLGEKWMKLLNLLTTDWKIVIANERRSPEQFHQQVAFPDNQKWAKEANEWIREGICQGNTEIMQKKYLIITCRKYSYEEARLYFAAMDAQLDTIFQAMRSTLTPLNTKERLRILYGCYRPGREEEFAFAWNSEHPERCWKNLIAPTSLEQNKKYLCIGDSYVSVLFAQVLPNVLDESKVMSELSNLPFPSMVTVDVASIPKKTLKDKLRGSFINNERAISQEAERHLKYHNYVNGISYDKQKRKDELEDYMNRIDDNDENGYFLGLLVAVYAESKEELSVRISMIQAIGASLGGISFDSYHYRQLKAFHTAMPAGVRQVDFMRSMLTSAMVAVHPFRAADLLEPGGTYYGVNRITKNIIIGDRKKLKNSNGIIVGHTGSGKSMLIKLTEILQTLIRTQDDIIVIDPQNEFESICKEFGGQFVDVTLQSRQGLNPFEIPQKLRESKKMGDWESYMAEQSAYAKALCYAAMTGIVPTGLHNTVLDFAIKSMYQKEYAKAKPGSPTIMNLYEELTRDLSQEALQLANSIKPYTQGSIFTRRTKIFMKNRFIVFGLKNISREEQEIMMVTIMHVLRQKIEQNQAIRRATHLIADEGQMLCRNAYSAEQLCNAFLTYRKFGGICTLAMQNITAALENPSVLEMVSNCEMKIFLDQGGADRNALASILELSASEYQALEEDMPGRFLMVWGKKILQCDCRLSKENPLYQLFQTSFHESV